MIFKIFLLVLVHLNFIVLSPFLIKYHLIFIGARFLIGGLFECDIAHRRSVAVMCMLYKIGCNRFDVV